MVLRLVVKGTTIGRYRYYDWSLKVIRLVVLIGRVIVSDRSGNWSLKVGVFEVTTLQTMSPKYYRLDTLVPLP